MAHETRDTSRIEQDIVAAQAEFGRLLTVAERLLASGDLPAAAAFAQIAARCAFPRHVGLFASPRLEALLRGIGRRMPTGRVLGRAGPAEAKRTKRRDREDVLHVLTYARPVGGDTRFVWRWIEQDERRRHSVAITAQGSVGIAIPAALQEALARSGGVLRMLDTASAKPLQQALELRALCRQADAVVLHLFPFDIVPVMALASGCDDVPAAFVDHSDHTFWIGGSVADTIVHCREQSRAFLRERRGLDPKRTVLLPIPLRPKERLVARDDAKRALGYGPETVILLTIATPFKYVPVGGTDFLDLVTPVLQLHPDAVLIAVGPSPEGAWQAASARAGGRIVALGPQSENDGLYAAADIYLDSFPFASNTSLLEAGSLGVPLLAFCPPGPETRVLGPGAPGFDGLIARASDPGSYREALTRLITDAPFRRDSGERVRERIRALHTGPGWLSAADDVFRQLERRVAGSCLVDKHDRFDCGPADRAVARLFKAQDLGLPHAVHKSVGMWPYRQRLPVMWSLVRNRFDVYMSDLLPRSIGQLVGQKLPGAGRLASRILRPQRGG